MSKQEYRDRVRDVLKGLKYNVERENFRVEIQGKDALKALQKIDSLHDQATEEIVQLVVESLGLDEEPKWGLAGRETLEDIKQKWSE